MPLTTSTATEIDRRHQRPKRARNMASDLGYSLVALSRQISGVEDTKTWPSAEYREDPVRFAREVLGIEPWSKQREILEAVRDHKRVAVRSGHKCGKSATAAMLALWFYCSFPDARVVMTSVTARQVDAILFREVKKLRVRAKRPIDGEAGELARTGIKAADYREIVGFTAREAEAVAGISGANLLYLCDEASGIPDAIYEAIEGNRAGGARIVLMSNPTRTEGEFYRAFSKAAYHRVHVSSEDSPNVLEGREVIPGLAGREWVEEKRKEWGEESPLFKVRVRGEFVLNEEGRILSLHAIDEAQERWRSGGAAEGRLYIGVDPAGPGEAGDETTVVLRRGLRMVGLVARRALREEAVLAELLGAIRTYAQPREAPVVVIDAEGPVGGRVYGLIRSHADLNPGAFDLVRVHASGKARREPHVYDRIRDELWANLARWIREGGAIVDDDKLSAELHSPQWVGQLTGKIKVTDKKELRKLLGRSPDRADGLALAVWEPLSMGDDDDKEFVKVAAAAPQRDDDGPEASLDPYSGLSAWGMG